MEKHMSLQVVEVKTIKVRKKKGTKTESVLIATDMNTEKRITIPGEYGEFDGLNEDDIIDCHLFNSQTTLTPMQELEEKVTKKKVTPQKKLTKG